MSTAAATSIGDRMASELAAARNAQDQPSADESGSVEERAAMAAAHSRCPS